MSANILIVDDSSLARRTLRQSLEVLGHTVEEAPDGASALERMNRNPPQLVILDMVMKGMYGLEVLNRIRQIDPTAQVIVVTADIQKSTAEQVRTAGAKGILNKPINREQLARAVETVLAGGDTWN